MTMQEQEQRAWASHQTYLASLPRVIKRPIVKAGETHLVELVGLPAYKDKEMLDVYLSNSEWVVGWLRMRKEVLSVSRWQVKELDNSGTFTKCENVMQLVTNRVESIGRGNRSILELLD